MSEEGERGCQLVTNCHQLKRKSPKDGKDKAVTVYPDSKGRYLGIMKTTDREYSIDLFRIILMILIPMIHVLGHDCYSENCG